VLKNSRFRKIAEILGNNPYCLSFGISEFDAARLKWFLLHSEQNMGITIGARCRHNYSFSKVLPTISALRTHSTRLVRRADKDVILKSRPVGLPFDGQL